MVKKEVLQTGIIIMIQPESDLVHILMTTSTRASLSDLADAFKNRGNIQVSWANSGAEALEKMPEGKFDLVITDENLSDMTGIEFVGKLVMMNPMMNCIAVSTLSPEDFHEASEGLGILMQLPPNPGQTEANELLQYLDNVLTLTKNVKRD